MMPDVLAENRQDELLTIELRVPPGLAHFAGHFPGFAILPAVVQIDWAVRLGRRYFKGLERSYGIEAFKCRAPVLPGMRLTLVLRHDRPKSNLRFAYSDGRRELTAGTVLFA